MNYSTSLNKSRQQGVTLIVVLVILVAMTFLGLGAMSDSNVQIAMVRNSQLQNAAHSAAFTEINAQIRAINSNPVGINDEIILSILDTPAAADFSRALDPDGVSFFNLLEDFIGSEYGGLYDSTVQLTQPNAGFFQAIAGNSLDPDSPIQMLRMQFQSDVTIQGTSVTSSQIQGFNYPSAN